MGDFLGKVLLVTGAAHGQGRATALAFAREGARVAALDLARPLRYPGYALGSAADLVTLAEEISALGSESLTAAADVRDGAAVSRVVAETVRRFGRIDVLFNNAGICAYGLVHEITEDEWDAMLDINLKGAWLVARHVIPVMMRQKSGVILNNSSVAGLRGMARLSHYAASKWGLTGLTKSWALELAAHGIRVNSIHPVGNTPATDETGGASPVPWVQPNDVAEAALFLASDRARYVTGAQYILDAGVLTK